MDMENTNKFSALANISDSGKWETRLTANEKTLINLALVDIRRSAEKVIETTYQDEKGKKKLRAQQDIILDLAHELTALTERSGRQIIFYNNTYHVYLGDKWIQFNIKDYKLAFVQLFDKMGVPATMAEKSSFVAAVEAQFPISLSYEQFRSPSKKVVNLSNGTLSLTTGQLMDYDADDNLYYTLPFDYNPNADCPVFMKFLNRIVPDVDNQKILQEYFGYCFQREFELQQFLVLLGGGRNGKSTFLDVMAAVFGEYNSSRCDFDSLVDDNDKHAAELLEHKLINFSNESGARIKNTSRLKALVAGEPIKIERKFEAPSIMTEYARIVIAQNNMLEIADSSEGIKRRFKYVPFDEYISDEELDVTIKDKIIDNELPGVFNWIMDGYIRIMLSRKLSTSKGSEDVLKDFSESIDYIEEWLSDSDINKGDVKVLFGDFYGKYTTSIREGQIPMKKPKLSSKMRTKGYRVEKADQNKTFIFLNRTIN